MSLSQPYDKCFGCQIEEAMSCVDDMRRNISGTVPKGCLISAISDYPQTACCPVYVRPYPRRILYTEILYATSAYPKLFECLEKIGCGSSEIYNSMMKECHYNCLSEASDASLDISYMCLNPSAAYHIKYSPTIIFFSILLLHIIFIF